jgi:hypothetical protein
MSFKPKNIFRFQQYVTAQPLLADVFARNARAVLPMIWAEKITKADQRSG